MNEVVAITGAAHGIGARTARAIAGTGRAVAVLYRTSEAEARELARELAAMNGGRAIAIAADLGDEGEVHRAFAAIDELGSLAGLVNNAVDAGPPARFVDWTLAAFDRVMRANVTGMFLCTREAVRRMIGRGGAIVSLTSKVAATTAGAGTWVPFAASKSAVETMSLGLAKELAAERIRVNTVRCGVIATAMRMTQPADYLARVTAQVPSGRMGDPDEVAAVVKWLVTEAPEHLTGATIDIAGGL